MRKKFDKCMFRVTYVDVTTSRRVSFATSVGIKDEPFGLSYLAVVLSIMRQHPHAYPCPMVHVYIDSCTFYSDCPVELV